MKIIGIDPGTEKSACIIWDSSGYIVSKGIYENKILIEKLRLPNYLQTQLVIEMIASYGMPVGKEVFETCLWIGRFAEAWESFTKQPYKTGFIYRKDVKMYLCGSTKAKDSNIRQALIDKYGPPGTKKSPNLIYQDSEVKMAKDLWAALAVCVTYEALNNQPK
jgi:hypothetical protein